ncbi:MAG: GNAT family N-acetyltransferase [Patescibacteria group bacterium]
MKDYNIQISEAQPEDIKEVLEVQKITWLATYVNEEYNITSADIESKDFNSPARIKSWQDRLLQDRKLSNFWVVKDHNKIAGFCIANRESDKNKLVAIYVLPSYQGLGLGKQLIKQALAWCGDDKPIFLDVVTYNLKAKSFYEKFGFKESGVTPLEDLASLSSGKTLPEIRMIRI